MAEFEEITLALEDGYLAYGRFWCPPEPRGAILYHHGIQSHCDWYETSARRLTENGYAVLQVDRRGCGRNEKDRGHAESAEHLISDAHVARDELLRRSGYSSYHVIGVSWGGKLAVAAFVSDPAGLVSLSLVTPGLFPRVGVSKSVAAEIGFAMLYEPHSEFDIPLSAPELFTKDPKWQRFIAEDARTLTKCTAGFYLASRRMDKIVAKLPDCRPVPIHLLLAGDEGIIENEKTARFIADLNWPGHRHRRFDGARHSLEFEDDLEEYFGFLVAFVDEASTCETRG